MYISLFPKTKAIGPLSRLTKSPLSCGEKAGGGRGEDLGTDGSAREGGRSGSAEEDEEKGKMLEVRCLCFSRHCISIA